MNKKKYPIFFLTWFNKFSLVPFLGLVHAVECWVFEDVVLCCIFGGHCWVSYTYDARIVIPLNVLWDSQCSAEYFIIHVE